MRMEKLLVLLFAVASPAQILTNPVQDYINKTTLLNNILSNSRAIAMSQQAQGGAPPSPKTVPAAVPDPTVFSHAGRALLPGQLAAKAGPQAQAYLASLIALYEQTAAKDGFPAHDLAYAFEYYLVNSYLTYHDLHDVEYSKDPRVKRGKDMFERLTLVNEKKTLQVSLFQERTVYRQLKERLAANSAVRGMSDQQKQEMTELLAIAFGVNFKAYLDGVNREDEGAIAAARQQARANLEKFTGVPVERIKIGVNGLGL